MEKETKMVDTTTKEEENIQSDGPYSPISLHKTLKKLESEGRLNKITLFVDGTGFGIKKDADSCIYVTPEECSIQSKYYSNTLFDGKRVPAYLYRHLHYMFVLESSGIKRVYETDQDVVNAFNSGKITEESNEYKQIVGLIKSCEHNSEAQQVIGLIQLITGGLSMCKRLDRENKEKSHSIRFYIDKPETSLHPSRQSRFMRLLMSILKEYNQL